VSSDNTARIKAIETRYAGCRFRSRLEARWAVFFDTLGIAWEYEPEGFATSAGPYLPDFRIQVGGYPCWFEVKPESFGQDDRHRVLCVETATPLIVASGMPDSYADQLKGERSPLTALLWGDRLEGAVFPAGDTQPDRYPAAFVGEPQHRGGPAPWSTSCPGMWDGIAKARPFVCDSWGDIHVALYGACPDHEHRLPYISTDVDKAFHAARSARFEHGERGR